MENLDVCTGAAGILQFVGYILTVFKIAIPLLIIGYGIFDFGHAVVSKAEEEIKKSTKSLLWRAAAGIAIFFIPSVVLWIFSAISDYNEASGDFKVCQACILHPKSAECSGAVSESKVD